MTIWVGLLAFQDLKKNLREKFEELDRDRNSNRKMKKEAGIVILKMSFF